MTGGIVTRYSQIMPYYRRRREPGGTFVLTLVTENRAPIFGESRWRTLLRRCLADARAARPFSLDAIVLLPDHLHLLMTLPAGDADFSTRIASIKATFTSAYLERGGVEQARSLARVRKRRRGVWQRWFWEHTVRDDADLIAHYDYLHFNPAKHGYATCPHAWSPSTFGREVERGRYPADRRCACDGRCVVAPAFEWEAECEPT